MVVYGDSLTFERPSDLTNVDIDDLADEMATMMQRIKHAIPSGRVVLSWSVAAGLPTLRDC